MATSTAAARPPVIVQVSVDVTDVDEAIEVGQMALRAGADWLEYGTPLVLFHGLLAMRRFAGAFSGTPIFCDAKIVDGARKYVVAAAEHGANYVSVCGVASDATIRAAVDGARATGTAVVADLYAVRDPGERAAEVVAMGAQLVYLHFGGDQRSEDPERDDTLALISAVKGIVDVPVGVVTFDAAYAAAAVRNGADILIIGHPYLTGPSAEPMLTDYVARVREAADAREVRPAGHRT